MSAVNPDELRPTLHLEVMKRSKVKTKACGKRNMTVQKYLKAIRCQSCVTLGSVKKTARSWQSDTV